MNGQKQEENWGFLIPSSNYIALWLQELQEKKTFFSWCRTLEVGGSSLTHQYLFFPFIPLDTASEGPISHASWPLVSALTIKKKDMSTKKKVAEWNKGESCHCFLLACYLHNTWLRDVNSTAFLKTTGRQHMKTQGLEEQADYFFRELKWQSVPTSDPTGDKSFTWARCEFTSQSLCSYLREVNDIREKISWTKNMRKELG